MELLDEKSDDIFINDNYKNKMEFMSIVINILMKF